MSRTVTLLSGEGIGPDIIASAVRVIEATGVKIDWDEQFIGEMAVFAHGVPLPTVTLDSVKRNGIALKGPTATPPGSPDLSYNVRLRKELDLYVNFRPVHSMPGVKTRWSDTPIDIALFRENTEDLYCGAERHVYNGAEAIALFTRTGCERIARFAFEHARKAKRHKLTVVHKANILKLSHGLFLRTAKDVAKEYPEIICNDLIADNFQMQLVTHPGRFDCILAPNFLGDLASDLCAAMVGGLGFAPGANIGTNCMVFEAVHGTAPDIAGKGIANPTSMVLSAALMLDHMKEDVAANRIREAVNEVLRQGNSVTLDVNFERGVSTAKYTDAIIAKLER